MISATSSLASSILSGAFGTPAPTAVNIGTGGTTTAASSSSPTLSALTSPDYILAESLGGSNPEAAFLSNVTFAQDTEALLNDPLANGAISGKASAYVQQIINTLAPNAANAPSAASAPAASSTTPTTSAPASTTPADDGTDDTSASNDSTSSLPPDGLLA